MLIHKVPMKRGYDSYHTDEALKQARDRGENVGWDRLFGVADTIWEGFWLASLTVIIAYLAGRAILAFHPLVLALVVTGAAACLAPRTANWLVRPYRDSIFRRLLWGLTTAALLLLVVRALLAVILLVRLRLQGVDEITAGVSAFHGAAQFTLMIALPVWGLYALWGWLRRRSLLQDAAAPGWRRWLPVVIVVAAMIFLGNEGAYFDSLKKQ